VSVVIPTKASFLVKILIFETEKYQNMKQTSIQRKHFVNSKISSTGLFSSFLSFETVFSPGVVEEVEVFPYTLRATQPWIFGQSTLLFILKLKSYVIETTVVCKIERYRRSATVSLPIYRWFLLPSQL
jgi:hypothetical protein